MFVVNIGKIFVTREFDFSFNQQINITRSILKELLLIPYFPQINHASLRAPLLLTPC